MSPFHFFSDTNMERARPEKQLVKLPIDSIRPNPYQPRKQFDPAALEELKDSIRSSGLIQPLVVRKTCGVYELIAGERRLRACKLLGMTEVPCVVQYAGEETSAILALTENLQRENLHYLEEAECYRMLLKTCGLTQEQLAGRLGKSQAFLANKLRLLRLSPQVRRRMVEQGLTERHARELLRLRDEKLQLEVMEKIGARSLTVKETARLVDRTIEAVSPAPKPMLLRLLKDYRLFLNTVKAGAEQLRDAGMSVEMLQTDFEDGVDLLLRVRKRPAALPDRRRA
ncbi:MAG: ParB/RepB/Spo0J family partition protein [Clostridia bacterium]|nr:ParB/RepB/Spo0J family partition protein [Clostridia bacterium]